VSASYNRTMYSAKLIERCRDGAEDQGAEEEALWGPSERIIKSVSFWKPSSVRAALLSARKAGTLPASLPPWGGDEAMGGCMASGARHGTHRALP